MIETSLGVILSKRDDKNQICLLDKELGKIFANSKNLTNKIIGSVLKYKIIEYKNGYKIEDESILYVPNIKNIEELSFFHHFIELVYAFVQFNETDDFIFDLLVNASQNSSSNNKEFQKILICKLLYRLGLVTEKIPHNKTINLIQQIPVDIDNIIQIDLTISRDMSNWISNSINEHSKKYQFKTLRFINYI